MADFKDLEGETICSVEQLRSRPYVQESDMPDIIIFKTVSGRTFKMYHCQECCEEVDLIEVVGGDLNDLIGKKILLAEASTSSAGTKNRFETNMYGDKGSVESPTWTFYKIRTSKDDIVLRWFGESNGFYSESVDFEEV